MAKQKTKKIVKKVTATGRKAPLKDLVRLYAEIIGRAEAILIND